MQTQQQVNQTTTNIGQSKFVLTDLVNMVSPQGVLLNLKSPQEIMHTFQSVVTQTESILDFQHVRLPQGGIEVHLFVMSSLATELLNKNNQLPSDPPQINQSSFSTPNQTSSTEAEECHQMIQKEMNSLFQYKHFQNDTVMANSSLQTLLVVLEARQTWMCRQGISPNALSEHNKADILRKFLAKCLDEHLCPNLGQASQVNLSEMEEERRNKWIDYLILRGQYVEGLSRKAVIIDLKKKGYWITKGGPYARQLKAGRARLGTLIWQKEMQAREAAG